jgi:DNA-binding NtrC family response regulator
LLKVILNWGVFGSALCSAVVQMCVLRDQSEAVKALMQDEFDIIVLDLVLKNGSAFAISDFANYRRPKARVVFVTNTSFFSDGSIFQHCSNACAYLQSETPPDDLVAMVEHYAERA